MNREYRRWHSPGLNREMELLVVGHAGAPVLVFPTSKGRFYEWEDRGMLGLFRRQVENGWLQFYCVDSVDEESWYRRRAHPGARAYRQTQYDDYLYHEVLPLVRHLNPNPFLITAGASFGAYHAMNFGVRHPDAVRRVIGLSGVYDIRRWAEGFRGEHVYLNNPIQLVGGERDPHRLSLLRRMDIIMATGREDRLIGSAREMSRVLWSKAVGNALREWDGWAHDWDYWRRMLTLYIDGHD
ncbi:MAG TPA: alpha/beta hydrolase-fold protein [Pyrinomonadaceae bacterium]